MFEDGYYVSFFSDDPEKVNPPKAIVIIRDGVVSISANPKSFDRDWLARLAVRLQLLEPGTSKYEEEASYLGSYWGWNGYFPNPSDFIALDEYDGRYDEFIDCWRV